MFESIHLIDPSQREQVLQETRFPGRTLIVSEDHRATRLLRPGRTPGSTVTWSPAVIFGGTVSVQFFVQLELPKQKSFGPTLNHLIHSIMI
jgi:hypothetical protein